LDSRHDGEISTRSESIQPNWSFWDQKIEIK